MWIKASIQAHSSQALGLWLCVTCTFTKVFEKDGIRLVLEKADTQGHSIGIGIGHEKVVSTHPYIKPQKE